MVRDAVAGARAGATAESRSAGAEIRRGELAAFLRSRRERISPEQVGLPRGRRRRTPGLRREEVAQLSTVGVTWYTWLEQGRDIHVSAQVLDAIARALLLDRSERTHLFALAAAIDPTPASECTGVPQSLQLMLEQLEPFPACVQNSRFDLLAYNRTYRLLMCDLDKVAPEDRNCLWLAFTHDEWRSSLVDRDETIRLMAAKFRAVMAEHVAEPAWKAMVKRLEDASPEFREIWARHEVVRPGDKIKVYRQSEVGIVRLAATSLWTGPQQGPKLLTYTPADAETHERLERLYALALAAEATEAAPAAV
ncbi:helix-turn-helix transcriptional regulator [Streptomyces samsunensis]|uniref:Helix-turn-helix transcriptional regulator n=1 Tax=Streptomyces malaysiensis subsp. samsunensis TaxID=459658 RepID=A0A9X2LPW7_STRMQ|nr:helix-turn-helix transcriptional regulator [Streptomyces samsunensis]MCQ8827552.1 helix-turn-helix transcriptional regulator [Streptomyces samsunensis]